MGLATVMTEMIRDTRVLLGLRKQLRSNARLMIRTYDEWRDGLLLGELDNVITCGISRHCGYL